jgi:phenylalanyl-tRNA synthetase beta chain
MKVPYEWLKEFLEEIPEPEILAEKLTLRGLEVESIDRLTPQFSGVVVGEIVGLSNHPKRSDLKIVQVYAGEKTFEVVCGAKNVERGGKVPLAKPGANLPGDVRIERKEILGVLSEGMICSEKELGLSEDQSGIFLLPDYVPIGLPLEDLPLVNDYVLDVNTPPNRGDLLSILGIAREVASITGKRIRMPSFEMEEEREGIEDYIGLAVNDMEGCPRYVLRMIKDVQIGQAPFWMRWRLSKCGMRPINNIVDVTNYVMLELGQPLHAFDYELLREKRIEVKVSRETFTFRTLDGQDRVIVPGDLLICDGLGPVAIAGIMGGENSEIKETTRIVALESAFFNPLFIRRTARRIGIKSEASSRFEKGIDIEGVDYASRRAICLMRELSGGKILSGKVERKRELERKSVYVRTSRLNEILGTKIGREEIKEILSSIGINVREENESGILFDVPSFRHDIDEYMDIVEEIARIKGYESIPETMPFVELKGIRRSKKEIVQDIVRDFFCSAGFFETVNFSFLGEKDIYSFRLGPSDQRTRTVRILNPLSKEMSLMRTFLAPGVLKAMSYNIKRGEKNLRFFELGHVFFEKEGGLPIEKKSLAFGLTGKERELFWKERFTDYDFFDIKGVLEGLMHNLRLEFSLEGSEEPYLVRGESAKIELEGKYVGWIGRVREDVLKSYEIEQKVYLCELDFDLISEMGKVHERIKPISKYPHAFRDFSFYIDERIRVGDVSQRIKAISDLINSVVIFDVFKREKRSVTFRVFFQSYEGTLRDDEIDLLQEKIIRELTSIEGVTLRT